MSRLRVVVVDDSAICRACLRDILEVDGDIEVVGEAGDAASALALVASFKPDLVTMDLEMPGPSGLDAIERMMATSPRPILVVTGQPADGGARALEAVRRGALDLAEKPSSSDGADAAALRARVRSHARVPVVVHVAGNRQRAWSQPPKDTRATTPSGGGIVGIGASTGGPKAIAAILAELPADFPGCVAIVQHLPTGFSRAFAQMLQGQTRLRVAVVERRTRIEPGAALIAPDARHLVASGPDALAPSDAPPVGGHRPSIDARFASLAAIDGRARAAVLLTGMGADGASGLAAMRARGALTIAQDEASSAVFGMPRAAIAAGAATEVLPLSQIAGALVAATRAPAWRRAKEGGA